MQRDREVTVLLAILNLAELVPDIAYFCAERGHYSHNQPICMIICH